MMNIIIKLLFVIIFSITHLYYKINNTFLCLMLYYICIPTCIKIKYCPSKYYHIIDRYTRSL